MIIISTHARERMRERFPLTKESKFMKIATKAFKSKQLPKVFRVNKYDGKIYRFFSGYVFIFKELTEHSYLLVTVYVNKQTGDNYPLTT